MAPGILVLVAVLSGTVLAGDRAANVDKQGVGLKGYDPVSYQDGGPAVGRESLTAAHEGVTYRFATAAHREAFLKEPGRYAPAYGGWCAYAMLEGDEVDIDPRSYKVIAGRTYLFYNGLFGDTLKKWNKMAAERTDATLVQQADAHWRAAVKK
jgi:YHS domain-containing protein